MPLYEFKCRKCGHRFEYLSRNAGDTPDACPKCGTKKPKKEISSFNASNSAGSSAACPTGTCPFS
jgi:putative FmdB family regulatory protein